MDLGRAGLQADAEANKDLMAVEKMREDRKSVDVKVGTGDAI